MSINIPSVMRNYLAILHTWKYGINFEINDWNCVSHILTLYIIRPRKWWDFVINKSIYLHIYKCAFYVLYGLCVQT